MNFSLGYMICDFFILIIFNHIIPALNIGKNE